MQGAGSGLTPAAAAGGRWAVATRATPPLPCWMGQLKQAKACTGCVQVVCNLHASVSHSRPVI